MGGKQFCTRCGTPFPAEVTRAPEYTRPVADPPRYRTAVLALASVTLLAGVGVGAWFLAERHHSPPQAGNQQGSPQGGPAGSQAGSPVAEGSAASSTVPGTLTPTGTPATVLPTTVLPTTGTPATVAPTGASAPGAVAIAPAVAGNAVTPQVGAFLDDYFGAINSHDYPAYVALRSPQAQGITQAQFDAGYGSTTDEDETLNGISSAANGDSIAQVTFTSYQSATNSPTSSACTAWNVSLYLVPNGDGYLLDNPPSSYRALYAACG
jgi:hypothetical protein